MEASFEAFVLSRVRLPTNEQSQRKREELEDGWSSVASSISMTEDEGNSAEVFEVIMDGNDVVVAEEEAPPLRREGDGDHLADSDDDSTVEAELTWRSDPTISLADWKIQIVVKGSTAVTTYHCHKSVLAVGPRRSQFFMNTFAEATKKDNARSANSRHSPTQDRIDPCDFLADTITLPASRLIDYTDHKSNTTRLEMERLAAQSIPALLDYMYSPNGDLSIHTDNATALFALSAQLGMKNLRRKVKDFWMRDLSMDNICTYYGHARVFKDNKILSHAEEFCAEHIFEVRETLVVEILTAVDPHFFLRVVTSAIMQGDEQAALRLSLLIAVYGNIHKNELSPSLFLRLTASTHLPTVEVKAATVLLELEDDICQTSDRMTSLKERAIAVVAKNWEEACFGPLPANTEVEGNPFVVEGKQVVLPRVRAHALEVFTKQTLAQAKRDRQTNAQELKDLRAFKAERQEETNREEALKKELETAKAEVAELQKVKDQIARASKIETESLRESKLKLQSDLNEMRKKYAVQEDMAKLKRVATGGASSLLRPKDNQQ